MIETIEANIGDGSAVLHQIIEANPIEACEDIDNYLHFLITQYRLHDEIKAISFIKESVIARSALIQMYGFSPIIFESYFIYISYICQSFSIRNTAENSSPKFLW